MLQQAQRFDVTALMDGMSEVRSVNVTRQVVSITIIDDSGNDSKPGQLTFAFFMDLPLSKEDAATMNILQAAQTAEVKPVFSFFLVNAVGSKATRLKQVAESLQVIPQESRVMSLSNLLSKKRDYENELGAQTLCKLLSDLSATTDVQKLNEKPTLWQANWVEVGWPMGVNLLKKDGSGLWFQTSLRDLSVQIVNVWMNEKSALSLSGLADEEAKLEVFFFTR